MPLRLNPDHDALAASVASLAARHCPPGTTRDALDELDLGARPSCWKHLVDAGFLSMHLPERMGGGGAGLGDVAVVVEAAGRAMVPGPFVPTLLAGLALSEGEGAAPDPVTTRLVNGAAAGCALSAKGLTAHASSEGLRVDGVAESVFGAPGSDLLLLGARAASGHGDVWFIVDTKDVTVTALPGVDLTRGIGSVNVSDLQVPSAQVVTGLRTERVRELAATLLAAEAVGSASWCFDTALAYVKIREQFGRPVGSFQAVKHKVANLAVRVEVLTAAAWDAARSEHEEDDQRAVAAAAAAIVCLPGARDVALQSITLLGGIGYTWEHDISMHWRRATAAVQLLGRPGSWKRQLGERSATVRRRFELEADDAPFRAKAVADLAGVVGLGEQERHARLADLGYISPHYPEPYGIGATPVQQLVLSQEFARVGLQAPRIFIAEFVLPTLLTHGTLQQQDRFVAATLRNELRWCQLFSEPGAGSDLAALSTRAVKVDGGWRLTGQKVWTSNAHVAQWAICLARTDPEAPKHKGISYFLVDMAAAGVEIRPLRETTGEALFNEVFLDDVFVADDCLVGESGEGWKIATGTLATERALIASGSGSGDALQALIDHLSADAEWGDDPQVTATIGALVAENNALDALNHQALMRRLEGREPGTEASLLKLASNEHRQAVATAALELRGEAGAATTEELEAVVRLYLALPAILMGGGTREIQLNVVAERVLGLPRA